ncbi:DUF3560 domain-containing protein [Streptomyces sp. DSM 42041]|uniref:DUF3560 domain-containing protein n=1 Tax=Streptomyces hazeniae TaxID=3075538 RepID=A0ABU2NJT9_9ACTN|nr:DUF3560 domain-containing protein [Streptomyces sp. DSM 42041]MDT0377255.1 DUF3560 domain-containing protein [Streptomyces sp. DSM 42041]
MAHVTITHTRANGTLLTGSHKGDGVFDIVRAYNFRYFRSLGKLGLPRSRDNAAQRWRINAAADALRAAGHEVTITINEDDRRTFAEAEADREERAEARAGRYGDRADRASTSADARRAAAKRISDSIPFGQPILIGHHSEGRARRDNERIDTNMRKAIAETERSGYWQNRSLAAENYKRYRNNPARTLRRIAKLEAELRRIEKWKAGKSAGGFTRSTTPEGLAELSREELEITEELEHWREVIAKAEADGFKVWGKDDFTKGDYVRIRGHWYEVLRVNAKSLTVPGGPQITKVINRENREFSWDDRAPYDEVTARKSAEEMAQLLAAAEQQAAE